ncbi:hypothetical protein LCGC14_1368820 [marine sediment metagenome]|uniref:Uncharacterized protein n=1 Tax=marine sediment metagenome TaxID=412755 RepID=A0A0F9K6D6_9ZZZZ
MTNQLRQRFSRLRARGITEDVFTDVRHRAWLLFEDSLIPPNYFVLGSGVPHRLFTPLWELALEEVSR